MSKLSKKKSNEWISPAFEDDGSVIFVGSKKSSLPAMRKKKPANKSRNDNYAISKGNAVSSDKSTHNQSSILTWCLKYKPKSMTELAIHKKKIEEVVEWLRESFRQLANNKKAPAPILLLTGPSGSGKTATIYAVANDISYEVQEWSNPLSTIAVERRNIFSTYTDHDNIISEITSFKDFLLRANKYSKLSITTSGKTQSNKDNVIILVEDYPNVFYTDHRQLHDIIRKYCRVGRCPLVFIHSDCQNQSYNIHTLFPKDIIKDCNIRTINFNPVAPTNISKLLNNIVEKESKMGIEVSKTDIQNIAVASVGDIRQAINCLQFLFYERNAHLKEISYVNIGGSKRKKLKSQNASKNDAYTKQLTGRDQGLYLFRALGKILHCKRDQEQDLNPNERLPTHLSMHNRRRALIHPEAVIEQSRTSSTMLRFYLHENYIRFVNDIECAVNSASYLSDSDLLSREWTSTIFEEYSSSVTVRGLMFSNITDANGSKRKSTSGWKPLHKPRWFSVNRNIMEYESASQYHFSEWRESKQLFTEFIPYVSLTNNNFIKNADSGQKMTIDKLCNFNLWKQRLSSNLLSEKEFAMVQMVDDKTSNPPTPSKLISSQIQTQSNEIVTRNDDLIALNAIVEEIFDDDSESNSIEQFSDSD